MDKEIKFKFIADSLWQIWSIRLDYNGERDGG